MKERSTEVLIVGGGTGAVAAALSLARMGVSCIVTEPTDWVGGQLTSQGVPPDENQWIEDFGATSSYRAFREGVRTWYRRNRSLTPRAQGNKLLNPGGGWVSRLCYEPFVGHAVMCEMLALHRNTIEVIHGLEPESASVAGDRIEAVTFAGNEAVSIRAKYVLDATELGDLYPLAGVEHMIGAEHRGEFGEHHARADKAEARDQQAISWCFAMEHRAGEDHRISKPERYEFWRDHVPAMAQGEQPWTGRLFSWTVPSHNQEGKRTFPFIPWPESCPPGVWDMWRYRRIRDASIETGDSGKDVCLVNWVQMDYWLRPLLGVDRLEQARALAESKELSRCLFYWMQNDCPRHDDKGTGYPGLRLAGDVLGTTDGFAKSAYIREPRRLRARTIVTEAHIGTEQRKADGRHREAKSGREAPPMGLAEPFADSVGIGHYTLDLHPSAAGRNSVYVPAAPFRIPMGSLIPIRVRNLLAAGKGIGVSHVANGCYRMHAVEWNVGESAGALAAFCLRLGVEPTQVHESAGLTGQFQREIVSSGVPVAWPWEG